MLTALLLPFLLAAFLAWPLGKYRDWAIRLSALVPIGLLGYFTWLFSASSNITERYSWLEGIPVALDLHLDGLAYLFILLITGIGTGVYVYADAYMEGHPHRQRLIAFLSLFMGAMLGVVLSDNLVTLFVFWELTSISSFFLIGFNNEDAASRKSALTALSITGGGGLMMFVGLLALGYYGGSYSLQELMTQSQALQQMPYASVWLVLIFLGAFTKSAQFPFHFWLPGAMKAPTPVSAYLHSATMVKAGVYLLARLTPAFNGLALWNETLLWVGGVTMAYAAFQSLWRADMKSILAYTTVSALGVCVFLLGLGSHEALMAAGLFILVHALYKAPLFLITGIVDHKTHSRDIRTLSGLRKAMPLVALTGFLAAASSGGIPPTLGFLAKDLVYESGLAFGWAMVALTVLTNVMLFSAGFLAGVKPFIGPLPEKFSKLKKPAPGLYVPALVLALLGLFIGIFPDRLVAHSLIAPVYGVLTGGVGFEGFPHHEGLHLVLGLSMLTLLAGGGLFLVLNKFPGKEEVMNKFAAISPMNVFTFIGKAFRGGAYFWTQTFQNGRLRRYLTTVVFFSVVLLGFEMITATRFEVNYSLLTEITFYEGTVIFILITSVLITVFSQSRLASVAALGVMGLAICIVFVFYSAPDLAMTQFTIDTLTVILFVLVLYKLPRFIPLRFTLHHISDGILALSFGLLISVISLEVLSKVPNREISSFYANNSYILAKGKNIVNVILVDFRGADTMVEIAVLSIAAIGVFSLLKLRLPKRERME
jgi:multicomponent Na+:H+ antiporter subunit A